MFLYANGESVEHGWTDEWTDGLIDGGVWETWRGEGGGNDDDDNDNDDGQTIDEYSTKRSKAANGTEK